MPEQNDNPYVGPRTFTRQESDRFFGREREARDLLSLVISERLSLFYAQSGAGKSSLIHTSLVPQLQEAQFMTLPVGRVGGELPQGVEAVDNIFIFNLLLSLDQSKGDPHRFTHKTLTEFSNRLTTVDGEYYYYDETIESDRQQDYDFTDQPPHVLIIDQFEEIFTTHLASWEKREDFFGQLGQAMIDDPQLWVVLALREDYVAALEPYNHLLPGKMRAHYYMQRMGYEAALQAVKRPAENYGRPFAPGVAETLVDNLRQIRIHGQIETYPGQFIEPVQLQVVCYQLWEKLKDRPPAEITLEDLQELGEVDTSLAQFYEQAIARAMHQSGESERGLPRWTGNIRRRIGEAEYGLRRWFDRRLITEAGTRGIVYQGEEKTGGLENKMVDLLARQFLLRPEIRAGGVWYELSHDRFVGPIQKSNADWRASMFKQLGIISGALIGFVLLVQLVITGLSTRTVQVQQTQIETTALARGQEALQAALELQTAEPVQVDPAATKTNTDRVRPLRPGLSISTDQGTAATLGYFLVDEAGQHYIITGPDSSGVGSLVLQPGLYDGGKAPDDVIGYMAKRYPMKGTIPAVNMTGLILLSPDLEFETTIPDIGPVRGVRQAQPGMKVRKVGRTSDYTEGTVLEVGVTSSVSLDGETQVTVRDLIATSLTSQGGDGGAIVVDEEGYAIGVIVAGSSDKTLLAPIEQILDSFEVDLTQ